MNETQKENLQRLLADNIRSLSWLEPTFDTPAQRKWLNHYREFLRNTYNDTTFEGVGDAALRTPMALAQIYVKEHFTHRDLSSREGQSDIEETLTETLSHELEDLLLQFDSAHQPIGVGGGAVLMGAPGSGKSTLIRLLAVACSTSNQRLSHATYLGRRMVIPFILRELDLSAVKTTEHLLELWAARVNKISGGDYAVKLEHAKAFLEQGWAIAAFDGIDEISQKIRKWLQRLIYAFRARFPKVSVLITGRPVGFTRLSFDAPKPRLWRAIATREEWQTPPEIPAALPKYYLRPFTDDQVNDYVERWYRARYPKNRAKQQQESDLLVSSLAHFKAFNALKRRPIYLANLTYVHDVKGKLPNSQARAYFEMIEAYLSTLDEVKRFQDQQRPEEAGPDFAVADKWQVLEWLAHDLHCGHVGEQDPESEQPFNLRITEEGFEQWLREKLGSGDLRVKIEIDQIPALLRYITARAGLLVIPEAGVISFSHLTFQEFLAGCWIFRRMGDHQFEMQAFLGPELLDRMESPQWHPMGLAFFGVHTVKQGGSFQEQLLERAWCKEVAEQEQHQSRFAFLLRLITEGESSLSTEARQTLWCYYWDIAIKNLDEEWVELFSQAAEGWELWGEDLHSELTHRFQALDILDIREPQPLLLYAVLPSKWLTEQWTQKAQAAGDLWRIGALSEQGPDYLDLHAQYPGVYELLKPNYTLKDCLLLGQTGVSLFTLLHLQRDQPARTAYQTWLASEVLVFKEGGTDWALARARDRARALALDQDRDRVLYRDRALARDRDLARALDLALDRARDFALDRTRARDMDLSLARTLDQDLALVLYQAFLTLRVGSDLELINKITNWDLSVAAACITPMYFLTPEAACTALEHLAAKDPEFEVLFEEDWFPYEALKAMRGQPFQVVPIEAHTHRLYASLLQELKGTGASMEEFPSHINLAPGEAMRKWHGDAVADQYLEDLKAAGWDASSEPWPPE